MEEIKIPTTEAVMEEEEANENRCMPIGKSQKQPTRSSKTISPGGGAPTTTKVKVFTFATSQRITQSDRPCLKAMDADTPTPNACLGRRQAKSGSLG